MLPLQNILDKIPEDTLKWKMKQIKRAASYANYRLQSVQAEVLLLVRFILCIKLVLFICLQFHQSFSLEGALLDNNCQFGMLSISCADRLLPSKDEGDRLQKLLPKCKIYFFEKHGHSLLLVRFTFIPDNKQDHNNFLPQK